LPTTVIPILFHRSTPIRLFVLGLINNNTRMVTMMMLIKPEEQ